MMQPVLALGPAGMILYWIGYGIGRLVVGAVRLLWRGFWCLVVWIDRGVLALWYWAKPHRPEAGSNVVAFGRRRR